MDSEEGVFSGGGESGGGGGGEESSFFSKSSILSVTIGFSPCLPTSSLINSEGIPRFLPSLNVNPLSSSCFSGLDTRG